MKLKSGCSVPFPELLEEGYMVQENQIIANVGLDKIDSVIQHFIEMHNEPLFFILEVPTNAIDETETSRGKVDKLHKDIYYIDGCFQKEALTIISRFGELLYNDGLSSFGYGGHESGDEIMFSKYNVLTIYSRNIEKYNTFFDTHNIKKKDNVITAWDTFSREHPGDSKRIIIDGKDVFSIPKQFEDWGMYFAERREE
jgi:hypothetical protein